MSDDRLRALERAWERSGSTEDEVAVLVERQRIGNLIPLQLHVAAFAGHVPARLALGGTGAWCAAAHHGTGREDCPRELHHHHDALCHLDKPYMELWCKRWIQSFPIGVAVRLAFFAGMTAYNVRLKRGTDETTIRAAQALLSVQQWLNEPSINNSRMAAASAATAESIRWARQPGRLLAIYQHGGNSTSGRDATCGGVLRSAFHESWLCADEERTLAMTDWVDQHVVVPTVKWALGEPHARIDALVDRYAQNRLGSGRL